MTKKGKGWIRVGQFATKEAAEQRKSGITARGFVVEISKGTKGAAWGHPHTTYRLWAKNEGKK